MCWPTAFILIVGFYVVLLHKLVQILLGIIQRKFTRACFFSYNGCQSLRGITVCLMNIICWNW